MNKFVIVASFALLASCGSKDEATTDATATEAAPASVAAAPVVNATPGSYDVTNSDGTKTVDTLMADGTFVSRDTGGKVVGKGTWAVKDGKTCFTGEGAAEECYTESAPAADGSFTATDAKGVSAQIKPRAK
ncbi:MAG TPA: hypothetical protein VHG29_00570 [Novosphingobium sp.]|nr:hypothetical protein [Novosphingobium sp.]